MTRTPEERITVRRDGFRRPRRIAPASRTLPSSSSNICFSTSELLFDDSGELRNLLRRQIHRRVLRVRVEQQDHVFLYCPVIDDAGATSLSSRPNRNSNLTYPTTTLDEGPKFRISGDPGLKSAIRLITQQIGNLPREDRGLNQLHSIALSANGVQIIKIPAANHRSGKPADCFTRSACSRCRL